MKTTFTQKFAPGGRMKNRADERIRTFLLVILLYAASSGTALFAQLPAGFIAKKLTTNNINECVTMSHAPDGRIFMAERSGTIKVLQNGTVSTVHSVPTTTAAEQGLLGITLHNNFAQNGKLYLYYTNPQLTRHYLDVLVLNAASQLVSSNRLMEFDPITNGYHNGGAMVFKDNLLYICIGESNEPGFAQNLSTYHGKVLRLLDDGQPAPGNPYYNTPGASRQQRSIWAIGMRNPWFMSMDPQTQKIYNINVGGGYEEINDITSPEASKNYNYGWGTDNRSGPDQNAATTILPIFAYNRNLANWNSATCAITSGVAFNPPVTNYPAQYKNKFYFGDWCTGWLRSIDLSNPSSGAWQEYFPTGFDRILGLTVGIDGNLYYSDYKGSGNIWRIEYTLTQTPQIVNHPLSQTVYAGEPVTFSVTATGSNPLSYQWQKNGTDISGATAASYTINATAASNAGAYRVVVTNSVASVTSNAATLTVNPYNAPPVATITTPLTSQTWSVTDVINYSGTGTDTEDGTLPASAFTWETELFHQDCPTCQHSHPGPNAADGVKTGTFTAINGGETSSNIWLRIYLKVTDSQGRIGRDSVDIYPNKVDLTATTSTPGLQMVIGLGNTTPYTKKAVVNATIALQAPSPQVIGNTVYTFSSWAHGGPANQVIQVPAVNTTYSATYTSSTVGNNNLALNKNAVASTPTNPADALKAVDGNATSRWESAFADPQWIYVDLGASYTVTRVKILWENAMAKDYRIEVSNDINAWGTPVKSVTGNSTALNDWNVVGVGRYVRIYGTARTTGYGYSIFELEVYGAPVSGGNTAPSVALTLPMNNATFFTPANITLNAEASDADGSVTKVEFYNGATFLGVDNTAPYSFTVSNAAVGTYAFTAKATDNALASTTSSVVNVTVQTGTTGGNLALNKPAFASSAENAANAAPYAVDGLAGTRWSSAFADPQWIYVDLGAVYNLSQIKITWEAAKARDYQIQVSNDNTNWGIPVKLVTNNTATINDHTISATGRFVRIYGTVRTTVYGYSIFELEVYGTPASGGNIAPSVMLTSPINNASYLTPATLTLNAEASDSDGSVTKVEFYNGATYLGVDNTAPYSFTVSNAAVGSYAFSAKATDDDLASTTSPVVNVTVQTGTTGGNLALNKSAFASSVENAANAAPYAVDGLAGTRWSSAFADPQWIYVDLGAVYNISQIKITWEAARAKDYQIQVANDITNWGVPVKLVTNNTALVNDHTISATGRFVRIYGTARTTVYGYSIFELEVYGNSVARIGDFSEALAIETGAALFPSPTSTEVALKANFSEAGLVQVTFSDLNGTAVLATAFETFTGKLEETVNISGLPAGVYFVKLVSGNEVVSLKLLKQ